MKNMRIVLAQLNLTVGDTENNLKKMIAAATDARDQLKAALIVFPELSLTGYLHEDLVFRKKFLDDALNALAVFKKSVQGIYCVIGHPLPSDRGLLNASSVIYNGQILGQYAKQVLPNHGVFDESRYYVSGEKACVVPIEGVPVGITICEDLWSEGPIQKAAKAGARFILSCNASPFEINKHDARKTVLGLAAKTTHLPIFYVNGVCGQDELVFDGGSMAINAKGEIVAHAGFFNETLLPIDISITDDAIQFQPFSFKIPSKESLIYNALVLGARDYVQKNHFSGALVGLSGGIDSALTLAIAVDALGRENVHAVLMPSRYTSNMSNEDALALIKHLQVSYEIISIEDVFKAFLASLKLSGKPDSTEENIQSRCRGVILMALSNKTGKIVLTTGNRSEMAVGYATLYGDMAGGLAVLKDVFKTEVYQLARYRNQIEDIIPARIIDRAPTAELAADQKDEDTLPPYPILDGILELYLNQDLGVDEIVAAGYAKNVVVDIARRIKNSEHKRRQSPIGIRIHHRAFGRDRRYPVTSGFIEK